MNILARIVEWLFPSLREMRIEGEMIDGGEDAISEEDAEWMRRRNERMRMRFRT